VLKTYSLRYVHYRFSVLPINFEIQSKTLFAQAQALSKSGDKREIIFYGGSTVHREIEQLKTFLFINIINF